MKKLMTACAATIASAFILTGCGDGRDANSAKPSEKTDAAQAAVAKLVTEPLVDAAADGAVCYMKGSSSAANMLADAMKTVWNQHREEMSDSDRAEMDAFLGKAGLSNLDIRWYAFSATGIADLINHDGDEQPELEIALAVSFPHDLQKIVATIKDMDEYKQLPEPGLTETTVAGVPAFKGSYHSIAMADCIAAPIVASLDGEILIAATSEKILAREIARYRGEASVKSAPMPKDAAFVAYVNGVGEKVAEATKANPDRIKALDMFMPNASAILLGLGRCEFRIASEGDMPVAMLELGMKSADDAAQLKSLADLLVTPTLQNAAEGEGEEAELAREVLANLYIAAEGSAFKARLTVTPMIFKAYLKAVEEAR